MGILIEDQEVNISFTRMDDMCQLYASDSTWISKMNSLCNKNPKWFKKISETKNSCIYEFPKKFLSICLQYIEEDLLCEKKVDFTMQIHKNVLQSILS